MTKQRNEIADTNDPIEAYFDLYEKMQEVTRRFHRALLKRLAKNARDKGIPLADYLGKITKELQEDGENEAA